jgi:hypothetical protein
MLKYGEGLRLHEVDIAHICVRIYTGLQNSFTTSEKHMFAKHIALATLTLLFVSEAHSFDIDCNAVSYSSTGEHFAGIPAETLEREYKVQESRLKKIHRRLLATHNEVGETIAQNGKMSTGNWQNHARFVVVMACEIQQIEYAIDRIESQLESAREKKLHPSDTHSETAVSHTLPSTDCCIF